MMRNILIGQEKISTYNEDLSKSFVCEEKKTKKKINQNLHRKISHTGFQYLEGLQKRWHEAKLKSQTNIFLKWNQEKKIMYVQGKNS